MTGSLIAAGGLVIVAIIGGAFTLAASIVTKRADRRVNETTAALDARKVNLDEFREVQARNEAALDRADRASTRCEERIAHLEEALVAEQSARQEAEARAVAAEQRAVRLERRVAQLEQVLRDNHMPVPPPDPD